MINIFLSFKTKYEKNNMKFEVTMTRFNEQKSKIHDFNYVFNAHFYFFTKNVTNIEIQNHQLILPSLNINECKYNFSALFSIQSIKF